MFVHLVVAHLVQLPVFHLRHYCPLDVNYIGIGDMEVLQIVEMYLLGQTRYHQLLCTDSDPCRCPEYIYLTDGINTLFISNIASLTGIGPYPFTFTYPASSINCGNFIITITVNGPNNFSISTAP
jgi:hypothetical protein